MIQLPPGGSAVVNRTGAGRSAAQMPLWLYWAQIARQQAEEARRAVHSDEYFDALNARLAGRDVPVPDEPDREGMAELKAAMVAIGASAHAIDGFYGSVKPLVLPPPSRAKRARQILETPQARLSDRPASAPLAQGAGLVVYNPRQHRPSRRGAADLGGHPGY